MDFLERVRWEIEHMPTEEEVKESIASLSPVKKEGPSVISMKRREVCLSELEPHQTHPDFTLNKNEILFLERFIVLSQCAEIDRGKVSLSRGKNKDLVVEFQGKGYVGKALLPKAMKRSSSSLYTVVNKHNEHDKINFGSLQAAKAYVKQNPVYRLLKEGASNKASYMQYLTGNNGVKNMYNCSLNEYMDAISHWIKYMQVL